MDSLELAKKIACVLSDKKAQDIDVIRVRDLTVIADYFVIASGNSNTQVRSLVDEVEFQVEQTERRPTRIEKDKNNNWIVLDYGDVVAHIFYRETREFYQLERLWADGEKVELED